MEPQFWQQRRAVWFGFLNWYIKRTVSADFKYVDLCGTL